MFKKNLQHGVVVGLAAIGMTTVPLAVSAQSNYPSQPVTLVVPYAAGGTPDILARLLSEHVGTELGQPLLIENRGGAGGSVGAQDVARAQANGYRILLCAFSCATSQSLYADNPPYLIEEDFDPIIIIGTVPSVLTVPAQLGVETLDDFLALAREQDLNYASSGVGSSPHLAGELLNQLAETQLMHITYQGAGQVVSDLLSNQVQVYFDNLPAALSNIEAGSLNALLVAQPDRAGAAPNIPTAAEAGLPDLQVTPWFGIFAPAGTGEEELDRLNNAFQAALEDPQITSRFEELGVDIVGGGRDDLESFLANEVERWGALISERNIAPN